MLRKNKLEDVDFTPKEYLKVSEDRKMQFLVSAYSYMIPNCNELNITDEEFIDGGINTIKQKLKGLKRDLFLVYLIVGMIAILTMIKYYTTNTLKFMAISFLLAQAFNYYIITKSKFKSEVALKSLQEMKENLPTIRELYELNKS